MCKIDVFRGTIGKLTYTKLSYNYIRPANITSMSSALQIIPLKTCSSGPHKWQHHPELSKQGDDFIVTRRNVYTARLCEFQDLKEECVLYSSYREFIDTDVYNLNAAITSTKTKRELFKDNTTIAFLDTIRYPDDPNKPYVHKPFLPFDEELNGITFSCPICADEFCVNDVDTENLPVSVYIACKHVACNRCIELMRKKWTCNPYHCPWCRQASFQITPINDALLRQTVLFCETTIRAKQNALNVVNVVSKKNDLKCVQKMIIKMDESLTKLNSTIETEKLNDIVKPDSLSKMTRRQKKRTRRYVNKLHTKYMNLKDKYKKAIDDAIEMVNKKNDIIKKAQCEFSEQDFGCRLKKIKQLKNRILSDFRNTDNTQF
jgi:hypothetical protein